MMEDFLVELVTIVVVVVIGITLWELLKAWWKTL